jgi:hypothetical protein
MEESCKDNRANIEGKPKSMGKNLGKGGNNSVGSSAPGTSQATTVRPSPIVKLVH